VPTILVAIPEKDRPRLEHTLFWRADMRRTIAEPADVFGVARTLSPDVILVNDRGGSDGVRDLLDQLRREPVTHDVILIVLLGTGESAAPYERAGVQIVLPADFGDATEDAPWQQRLEALLNLRQRRETRVLAEFPVEANLTVPGETGSRAVTATALNISSRGLLLETRELLPRGARAELTFKPSAAIPEIAIVGEVVRTAVTADGHKLAGVHFVVVRKEARLAVRDFLRSHRPDGQDAD
jgi:hypothetical protein